jgi:hypothetical protein
MPRPKPLFVIGSKRSGSTPMAKPAERAPPDVRLARVRHPLDSLPGLERPARRYVHMMRDPRGARGQRAGGRAALERDAGLLPRIGG